MNLICKIFWHRMYFDTSDVAGPSSCRRWKCNHKEPRIKWPRKGEEINMNLIPWEKCFCGSTSFYIQKPGKWWKIICQGCKCERNIKSPGVSVDEYSISIPFAPKHIDEPTAIEYD